MAFPFVGTHTEAEWATWQSRNVELTDEGAAIAPADRPTYGAPRLAVEDPGFVIADADVDDCGDLYLLSDAGDVYRYDRPSGTLQRLPCTFRDAVAAPRGLAVTGDTIYVADAGGGGRIHAVSRHVLQPRWIEPVADPVALVGDGDDVYLLDAGPADEAGVLARVGHDGATTAVMTELTDPVDAAVDGDGNCYVLDAADGTDPRSTVRWVDGDPRDEMDDEEDAADHSADAPPEPPPAPGGPGSVLIPPAWFRVEGAPAPFEPTCIAADDVGEVVAGVDPEPGEQRPLFGFRGDRQAFERIASFSGGAKVLTVKRDGETCEPSALYVVAGTGDAVRALDAVAANGLNGDTGRYDAQLLTRLDAGVEGVQWHRVTMDLSLPAAATQVRLRYYATDDPGVALESGAGGLDPGAVDGIGEIIGGRLRAAGVENLSELVALDPATVAGYASTPTYPVSDARAEGWIEEARGLLAVEDDGIDWQPLGKPNPRDALLEDATGRYLFVRLELVGTEFDSPTVGSFRAYFPRRSYLRYLPALYREDRESAAFLERFLSIFESVFTDVEEEIGAAIRYLDPDGIPSEYVSWLERWLALEADETWTTAARRDLISAAPDLFKYRGTRAGLLATLRIFLADRLDPPAPWTWALDRQREAIEAKYAARKTGANHAAGADDAAEAAARAIDRLEPSPLIWEARDLSCIEDESIRPVYERLLPCPQCFAVLVPPYVDDEPARTVERIVRSQQPAHGAGRAIRLRPWIRLAGDEYDRGHHTYLGVNSALADRDLVLEESGLGANSKLAERESDGQLELRSRLGTDTRIS